MLLMPFSHHGSGMTPFIDALFTATSAATVTGLVIQDTATYWTRIGQVFILGLIFVGGLGFMSIATFLLVLFGQRVTLTQRLLMKESFGVDHLGGLARLTIRIVFIAAGVQLVGFVALLTIFALHYDYSLAESIWQSAFHAVSAFNNAGFVALPDTESLSAFHTDKPLLAIISVLILLGSISFWVMVDLVRFRKLSLLTLNTKLVLVMSFTLIVLGSVVFFLSEYNNSHTLGESNILDKAMISIFESISGRTAGFSTVNFSTTQQHTNFFFLGLMFIGGASASVAGGIKVNTLAVVLVAVFSTIRGKNHASAFGREIPQTQVQRAMTIGTVASIFVFLVAFMLIFSEREFAFIDLLFESISAFGTVGLSTGPTAELSHWGHFILISSMFVGRIGPLILGLAMIQRSKSDLYRYAQERVTIG